MKNGKILIGLMSVVCILKPIQAISGPYTDSLSKCLVESTTVKDRNQLVRWMFSAASKHPAVKELVDVTPEMLDKSNKNMGDLMNRLLLVTCKKETTQALKFEGNSTLEASFGVLGQVAGREMFSHPAVTEGLSSLSKYVDSDAVQKLNQ